MLSIDVALAGAPRVDRVVAMSGVLLVDSVPALTAPHATKPRVPAFPRTPRSRGAVRDRQPRQDLLEKHGFPVTWRAFDGGHDIPEPVLADVDQFLFS